MDNESKTSGESCVRPCEETLCGMARLFLGRSMYPLNVYLLFWILVFCAVAVYAAVSFFRTDEIRLWIMYAAIFVCAFQAVGLIKVFAWQMIHRRHVSGVIRRLEERLGQGRA